MPTNVEIERRKMRGTAFERIVTNLVPRWIDQFHGKNKDYNSASTGWEPHTFLGVRGQFADIWRKVGKLKKSLWDGEELTGEQPKEIIQDLISHLFLTLDLMEQQEQAISPSAEEIEAWQEDDRIPPGMAVMGAPDGGDREGARRLGITEDRWEELVVLADAVQNTGKPEILEQHGYFLQVDPSPMGMCCENCRWERTLEGGREEFHTYKGSCKYRIRKRREP